jgi:heat shock protein HtpX
MTDAGYSIPRHPVGSTAFILIVGAAFGALMVLVFTFFAATIGMAAGGPRVVLVFGPILLAIFGFGAVYVLVGVPVWALIGGLLFAARAASGGASPVVRAKGVTFFPESHPIHQTTQRMAAELGLPPIRHVGWYDAEFINAFAMGTKPDNALIAFSRGAVEKLSRDQLDAVIGHELGHVASNDMARMTYALGIREALSFFLVFQGLKKLARWIFTPLSELELLRFSRMREFTADAIGAHLTSPDAMISVLETLKRSKGEPGDDDLATVRMFAFGDRTWLSTHPPLEDRIAALKASAAQSASRAVLPPGTDAPLYAIPG